ncbi:MAG: nuclear transport factor 2 family protein [Myxococcales bacterium]|nr:nuclear transport factor 2 family protein [Myxococcales bacterium]
MKMKRMTMVAVVAATVGATGCAGSTIGGTQIKDTKENREILRVVETYHEALESLDADAVLALVSPDYYEDHGNTDAADDFDYEALAQTIHTNFDRTKTMQVDFRVDAVEVKKNDAFAEVYYDIRAHNDYPSGTKWERTTDRTRLRFRREGERWRIVAGL